MGTMTSSFGETTGTSHTLFVTEDELIISYVALQVDDECLAEDKTAGRTEESSAASLLPATIVNCSTAKLRKIPIITKVFLEIKKKVIYI